MWIYIALAITILCLIYLSLQSQKYWHAKGVKYPKPWLLFGNMAPIVFKQKSLAGLIQDFYNAFPNERYVGIFQFFQPTLIIKDPELIKEMFVKNFDSFPEHQMFAPEGVDPIWDKNLFSMRGGKKWRDMRSTLSPSFTSSKMKLMFDLVKECGKQFIEHFQAQNGLVVVEMKDTFTKCTNDVIATTAFGITCNSLKNPENEFYKMGKLATDFSGLRGLLFFVYTISPTLMELFKVKIIREKASKFFSSIILEAINYRTSKNIVRPDMIHLLLESRKNHKPEKEFDMIDSGFSTAQESNVIEESKEQKAEITDEDIIAQAFIFFFAGFDTTSTLMSFACYELAVNTDIQSKLRDEIDEALKASKNGDITYETLMGMKYLDMVISETLRKWPPSEITDRHCARTCKINPVYQHEKTVQMDPPVNCWIPIYAIHRDSQYYPEPEKFDPERFNDQNKNNIKPFTYLPFGVGPRICIGSRFALMETKLVIALLLSKFEIVPVGKTQIPLMLQKGGVGMITENGVWVGVKPRVT